MIHKIWDYLLKLRLLRFLGKWGKRMVVISGILSFILVLFAFTSGPFWIYFWLGTSESEYHFIPDTIVILGGGGMPSETGLMRCFYGANATREFPSAEIIIALPGDTLDENSSLRLMQSEMEERGILADKIGLSPRGMNTRGQAIAIRERIGLTSKIIIVTSPEHMKRSIMTFRKAGFKNVGGSPAFEFALEGNLAFNEIELGGRKIPGPGFGNNVNLRYRFWTHLKYETLIIRESIAILWYKLKGWA